MTELHNSQVSMVMAASASDSRISMWMLVAFFVVGSAIAHLRAAHRSAPAHGRAIASSWGWGLVSATFCAALPLVQISAFGVNLRSVLLWGSIAAAVAAGLERIGVRQLRRESSIRDDPQDACPDSGGAIVAKCPSDRESWSAIQVWTINAAGRGIAVWPRALEKWVRVLAQERAIRILRWCKALQDIDANRRIREADDSVVQMRPGWKSLILCGACCAWGYLMLSSIFADAQLRAVMGQFLSLVGLSLVVATTPAIVAVWIVLVLISRRPEITAALKRTGDLSGRGLVCGLIIGIGFFATQRVLPLTPFRGAVFEANDVDWLSVTIGLSVVGSIAGFALAQLDLMDSACRSQLLPRPAWLVAPFLVAAAVAALGLAGIGMDAPSVYTELAHGLAAAIEPIPAAQITAADVARDWRYAFAGDQSSNAAGLPDPWWLAGISGFITACSLWRRWSRSTQRLFGSPSDVRDAGAPSDLAPQTGSI